MCARSVLFNLQHSDYVTPAKLGDKTFLMFFLCVFLSESGSRRSPPFCIDIFEALFSLCASGFTKAVSSTQKILSNGYENNVSLISEYMAKGSCSSSPNSNEYGCVHILLQIKWN